MAQKKTLERQVGEQAKIYYLNGKPEEFVERRKATIVGAQGTDISVRHVFYVTDYTADQKSRKRLVGEIRWVTYENQQDMEELKRDLGAETTGDLIGKAVSLYINFDGIVALSTYQRRKTTSSDHF